ncbi:MAG: GNAT family N-acetyltransferase [Anaerolineae bacterium]|nr:GNAT family N-acetyltransferase [Anaerolineae bacterium]
MKLTFKSAESSDLNPLLTFAQEFNQEDHHPFHEAIVRAGLIKLLNDGTAGRIWLIQADAETVGYVVLTLGYRLAYGRYAFIDEIYVRPAYRSQGIGRQAIAFAEEICRELGVKALHLEVEQANAKARALYLAVGFVDYQHYLMTCWLKRPPTHSAGSGQATDRRPPQDVFEIRNTTQAGNDSFNITFTSAQNSDIEILVRLRQESGAEGQASSRAALGQVINDDSLGRIWLIETDHQPVGYVVVTFSYSLEFHGRDALLDELYLRPSAQAFSKPSLKFAQAQCQALGVNALHAEMERANTQAQNLYRAVDFEDDDSYLMTKWLNDLRF